MSNDLKNAFWNQLKDVRAGLLSAEDERPVPMSPQADADNNAIWFITARGSAADRGAQSGGEALFHVADSKAHLYANVSGKLTAVNDSGKLDELWNAFAAAWFEDGRDDSAVQLVKFTPHDAEIWAGDGGASFMYEIAKANLTGDTPDTGDHGRVVF
ncbi:general stress protein [Salipiger aestuarii]|uniref:General stress protein 26 n=1 Tax=Salipiger aestuarii TaxID=568098 RepID=A0A327YAM6_9RHOB|nr:pyridoxamine 5'-phosphate oxidase family protein [Salipiger aestuarii]EIE51915.1 putative general stress protein 26 [Citreicella sp. 357]KAA8608349.1 general stress protein [Salipiger aestuarii]KAA8612906.1 general stress protein [Salipiger aestuarii]KAB2542184.1 general stress protein [Salipiger aestuarii]RAK16845.1 general stress protein 26 [Salipiger aestuarii]